MYRLYRNMVQQLLVLLIYYRETGRSYSEAQGYVRENLVSVNRLGYGNAESNEKLKKVVSGFVFDKPSASARLLDTLIDDLAKQLSSSEASGSSDRDLIDTIVRITGLPHARGLMSCSTMQRLRDALLLPDEIVELKKTFAAELHCESCSHKFVQGEMASIMVNGPNSGAIVVCTRCRKPSSMANDYIPSESISVKDVKGLSAILSKKVGSQTKDDIRSVLDDLAGFGLADQAAIYAGQPGAAQAGEAFHRFIVNAGGRPAEAIRYPEGLYVDAAAAAVPPPVAPLAEDED